MRTLTLLASLSALTLVSACAYEPDGYYDSNGNWVATGMSNPKATQDHAPIPNAVYNHNDYYGTTAPVYTTTTTTYSYDRAGYYDPNGVYVGPDYVTTVPVPADMFPPRGMCRVWFSNRAPNDQPAIESCSGIRSRVPAGAYVIYGG